MDQNPPMTDDKFYTSLPANNIMAKLTNHVQRTRLITPSTDKHYSLDSEDDFRSGCRNVSHQQQFFSELLSPGRSHNTNYRIQLSFHHFWGFNFWGRFPTHQSIHYILFSLHKSSSSHLLMLEIH